MPFIDAGDDWKDTKEQILAQAGPYDLDIADADLYQSEKSGNKSIRVRINFTGKPDLAPIMHYLPLVNKAKDLENDKEKGNEPGTTSTTKMRMTKRFLYAFKIKWNDKGFDTNTFKGKRARLEVGIQTQELDGGEVRRSNVLKLPQLPEGMS